MENASVPVVGLEAVGRDAISLVLETPEDFDARPGQFVKLIITIDETEHSRFYTISSPSVRDSFELTIEIDPDGAVTPFLRDLEIGDEVTVSGPYGNAYYEDEESVLVLAGGPGIGPAVGIAERSLDDGGSAAIVYRNDQLIHEDRLERLEADGVSVHTLDPAESLAGAVESAGVTDRTVFVYGFVDFLDDAMDALAQAGASPDEAKVENFG